MRMGLRRAVVGGMLVGFAAVPSPAAAPDIVKARLAGYRELGAAFKNVNDELRSGTPQAYVLQLSARQIRDAAKAQYGWFPRGTGPQPGLKTAAKPEIWTRAPAFKAAQDAYAAQANAFYRFAAAGDIAKMRAQVKPLGATCGGCHRAFRAEDRH